MARIQESEIIALIGKRAEEDGMTAEQYVCARTQIANLTGKANFIPGDMAILVEVEATGDIHVLGSHPTIADASQEIFSITHKAKGKGEPKDDRSYLIMGADTEEIEVLFESEPPRMTNLSTHPRFTFGKK